MSNAKSSHGKSKSGDENPVSGVSSPDADDTHKNVRTRVGQQKQPIKKHETKESVVEQDKSSDGASSDKGGSRNDSESKSARSSRNVNDILSRQFITKASFPEPNVAQNEEENVEWRTPSHDKNFTVTGTPEPSSGGSSVTRQQPKSSYQVCDEKSQEETCPSCGVNKESIRDLKKQLEERQAELDLTRFIHAKDYLYAYRIPGVTVTVGGDDQWCLVKPGVASNGLTTRLSQEFSSLKDKYRELKSALDKQEKDENMWEYAYRSAGDFFVYVNQMDIAWEPIVRNALGISIYKQEEISFKDKKGNKLRLNQREDLATALGGQTTLAIGPTELVVAPIAYVKEIRRQMASAFHKSNTFPLAVQDFKQIIENVYGLHGQSRLTVEKGTEVRIEFKGSPEDEAFAMLEEKVLEGWVGGAFNFGKLADDTEEAAQKALEEEEAQKEREKELPQEARDRVDNLVEQRDPGAKAITPVEVHREVKGFKLGNKERGIAYRRAERLEREQKKK